MAISLKGVWDAAEYVANKWQLPNLYLAEMRIFLACLGQEKRAKQFEMTQVFNVVHLPFEACRLYNYLIKGKPLKAACEASGFIGNFATSINGLKALDLPNAGLHNWTDSLLFFSSLLSPLSIVQRYQKTDDYQFSVEDGNTLVISCASSLLFFKKAQLASLWMVLAGVGYLLWANLMLRARRIAGLQPIPGSPAAQSTLEAYTQVFSSYAPQTHALNQNYCAKLQREIEKQGPGSLAITMGSASQPLKEMTAFYLSQVVVLRMKDASSDDAPQSKNINEIGQALNDRYKNLPLIGQILDFAIQAGSGVVKTAQRYFENRKIGVCLGAPRKGIDVVLNADTTILIQHHVIISVLPQYNGMNSCRVYLRRDVAVENGGKTFKVVDVVQRLNQQNLPTHLPQGLR